MRFLGNNEEFGELVKMAFIWQVNLPCTICTASPATRNRHRGAQASLHMSESSLIALQARAFNPFSIPKVIVAFPRKRKGSSMQVWRT